jgi:hypothetical protein
MKGAGIEADSALELPFLHRALQEYQDPAQADKLTDYDHQPELKEYITLTGWMPHDPLVNISQRVGAISITGNNNTIIMKNLERIETAIHDRDDRASVNNQEQMDALVDEISADLRKLGSAVDEQWNDHGIDSRAQTRYLQKRLEAIQDSVGRNYNAGPNSLAKLEELSAELKEILPDKLPKREPDEPDEPAVDQVETTDRLPKKRRRTITKEGADVDEDADMN